MSEPLCGSEPAVATVSPLGLPTRASPGLWVPAVATIAKKLGVSRPTVVKYLRVLAKHGLISWQARSNDAREQQSHLYTVHPALAPAASPRPDPRPAPAASTGGRQPDCGPSPNGPAGGRQPDCDKQDSAEQELQTSGIALSALQTQQPLAHLTRKSPHALVFPLTREEQRTQAQQQRCQHPVNLRRRTTSGERWCSYCRYEFPRLTSSPPERTAIPALEGPVLHGVDSGRPPLHGGSAIGESYRLVVCDRERL
jgi:hypothetical protein